MSDYRNIKISEFTYDLPGERIAKYPLPERDHSNLLVWKKGEIGKDVFKNIVNHLSADSMLVFNNTRVIHARLLFRKETGARIEVFCLEPVHPSDHQLAFQQKEKATWKCMVGNAKKWKNETLVRELDIKGKPVELKAKKTNRENNSFSVEFSWTPEFTFAEIIEEAGILPLPPYLHRKTEPGDEESYQTIYAKADGSVAAPTAGLHFTESVMAMLSEKDIALREVTLHVGAGTFQPVKSDTIEDHSMHHETVIIARRFIEELINNPRKIIAVGTTSIRSLESLYWLGVKLNNQELSPENIEIGQWEPYENEAAVDVLSALKNIIRFLEHHNLETVRFSTQIIIVPGYRFKLVDGMITNFHQPQSTLLLLIGAFLGSDWKRVYDFALNNNFRFLSYGDSNLYLK